jgi:hypothetical protein
VKPVFIKDRVLSPMELIASLHASLPHVPEESGHDLTGHSFESALNRAQAPSHVFSAGSVTFTVLAG